MQFLLILISIKLLFCNVFCLVIEKNGESFYVSDVATTWQQAETSCTNMGGQLISEGSQVFMNMWMDSTAGDEFCQKWGQNGPEFEDCHKKNHFACLLNTRKRRSQMDGESPCPQNMVHRGTSCYWIGESNMTYSQGQEYCALQGGHLVHADKELERTLLSTIPGIDRMSFWIGLRYDYSKDTFAWSDGTFANLTGLDPCKDDTKSSTNIDPRTDFWEECTVSLYDPHISYWVARVCHAKYGVLCERELDCPNKRWKRIKDTCYFVSKSNEKLCWSDARSYCQKHTGDLVTLTSENEVETVKGLILQSDLKRSWIGLHYENDDADFKWIDGSDFDGNQWAVAGKPEPYDGDQCVFWKLDQDDRPSGWYNIPCFAPRNFICHSGLTYEKYKNVNLPIKRFSSCPGEHNIWKEHGNHCYAVFTNESNYEDAKRSCRNAGGDLFSVHSQEEFEFVGYLMQRYSPIRIVWTGLVYENNVHKWVDGTPTDFVPWAPNHPWHPWEYTCSHLSDTTGLMHTYGCFPLLNFICKKRKQNM